MPEPAAPRAVEETVLAFDFGLRRTGVAVGNTVTRSARPLVVISQSVEARRFEAIGRLIREWQPQRLVVGVPREEGGTLVMTERCARFARQLAGRYGLPVETVDERYSSEAADGEDDDGHVDAQAAALILEQWFHDGR